MKVCRGGVKHVFVAKQVFVANTLKMHQIKKR